VPIDLSRADWLARLLDEELRRHALASAQARLPAELEPGPGPEADLAPSAKLLVARSLRPRRLGVAAVGPKEAFLEAVRGHLDLLLDLAQLAGDASHGTRRRAAIAACLAEALGETDLALDADPAHPDLAWPLSVERALAAAGRTLKLRTFPPGDPLGGLPLYPGSLAVLRRHLARIAMGAHRHGDLDPEALARHRAFAQRELVLLVEALSGLMNAAGPPPPPDAPGVRARQLLRLGLPRAEAREARRAMVARPPAQLAAAAPERVRPFLLEQLLLAQLRARLLAGPAAAFIEAFCQGGGIDAPALAAAQVEAAAQHDDHLAWFKAVEGAQDWQALAERWEATGDQLVEQVTGAVTENWEALLAQLRDTGDLGQLLGKAVAGKALSRDEKQRMRLHLVDLAKAVPALAIFAAPGGLLLLPLLAKLLPFSMLPSAWDKVGKKPPLPAETAKEQQD
jgi:hypothetical protein